MIKVIKRDGRKVVFEKERIANAILKAMEKSQNLNNGLANKIAEDIETYVNKQCRSLSVEEIQDMVEKKLMNSSNKAVAKEYITYREKRNIARGQKTYETFMTIVNAEKNDITRENANMNADTPAGMMMKFASESTKPFVDDMLLSPEIKDAVKNNYIHIHDKDYYPTKSLTCLQHPLDRILQNGFRAGHGASRPAKRIETASIIGCISMETVQNEMHGGQAIPAFDFYLAPYVKKTFKEELNKVIKIMNIENLIDINKVKVEDYIIKSIESIENPVDKAIQFAINEAVKRVHQAMEAFIHNMNTIHSRGGNQVVFSSLNYGTDTSAEGRCIIRELLLSTYEGVGNGETPIFPIQIWKKKKGVNFLPQDRNYDLYKLACKVTAKRFFPNFLNLDATFNQHEKWDEKDPNRYIYEVATMGCRTRVFEDIFGEKTSIGRGNLSFTSINIVKLALEAKERYPHNENERIRDFFSRLEKYLDIVAKQLYERFNFQSTALAKQFPLLMSGLWNGSEQLNPNDKIKEVIKTGTLGIGFIGLAECLVALTGCHHGENKESQKLGIEVITYMRDKAEQYKEKYKLNYSILGTPAEGLSGRFVKQDKKDFGIITNVTERDYYTNSSHVPVWYKCTAEHKAIIEAPYHELERGGHIFYVELDGDATHNPQAIMGIVDLMDKYNIGYGSINHLRNRCLDCGYESAEKNLKICPNCRSKKVDTIERITGYLVGTVDSWNDGKKAELEDRITHSI
ncbi:anaerobic ribonucleoside triphosphate reductase [Clostridium rectalis]|uniref:anaerobic ribonucleoside triphosphate reductase n=1 Tax=Clostridium rectalis TaxID=2040295 RepID=UPI000F6322B9|nr:anaerobic ribonucleoside triphosphate reductase [Clostridium rectalis]